MKTKEQEELEKGCGIEVCAVVTKTDGKTNDEPDIQGCGEFCPYHKEIHYCDNCLAKLQEKK